MKQIVMTLCAVALLATASYAQKNVLKDRKSPEERARIMADAMQKRLNLDDAQKEQIYAINLERVKARKINAPVERGNKETVKQKLQERKAALSQYDNRIQAVLNDQQKKMYHEQKEIARKRIDEHRKKGHKGKPGGAHGKS